jgi:uncharacterized C2H2 Zn-finger protein
MDIQYPEEVRSAAIVRVMNRIGKDVQRCPQCGGVLSDRDGYQFCRCCHLSGVAFAGKRKEREA